MKKIFLSALISALFLYSFAQQEDKNKMSKKEQRAQRINAMAKQEEEGIITYRKHTVFGGKLTSDGFGGFVEVGRAQSVSRSLLFQLEITEHKHAKEEKQQNPNGGNASPLIYGKINFFYPVKLGVQKQFLLGNKSNKNGVSITANIGGGISLGLLRAYEIEVDDNATNGRKYIRYDSPDSLMFANPVSGNPSGPGLGRGWNHLKLTPGLYVKPALRFDYGRYNDLVSVIEVGVAAEFYAKKIPQMISNKQKQFFFSAYFAVVFGRRK